MSHCGICGTDLHLVLEKYARPDSVLGHEWAGTIAAVGADVIGLGDRRARRAEPDAGLRRVPGVQAGPAVGVPAARAARPPRLHARRVLPLQGRAVGSALLRVPDSLSTRAAALTEPTAIAIHTVNLSGAQPGDRVLVTGGGPVGLLTTAVLRARGIDDITVSEPAPLRRERALAVGAAG